MIVYGKQIVLHLLQKHPYRIEEIYLTKEIDKKLFGQIKQMQIPIIRPDFKKAQAMARGGNHQGMLAKISPLEPLALHQICSFSRVLVLCGVSDVGNIGSLARSAYALGVEAIVWEGKFSPKAIESIVRLSSGALLDLPFCCCGNLLDLIHQLKQARFECYGANMDGEKTVSPASKWALFLGSEGNGLSGKVVQKMDKIVSVEMRGGFDSLNVGVAGGILMYGLVQNGRE